MITIPTNDEILKHYKHWTHNLQQWFKPGKLFVTKVNAVFNLADETGMMFLVLSSPEPYVRSARLNWVEYHFTALVKGERRTFKIDSDSQLVASPERYVDEVICE